MPDRGDDGAGAGAVDGAGVRYGAAVRNTPISPPADALGNFVAFTRVREAPPADRPARAAWAALRLLTDVAYPSITRT